MSLKAKDAADIASLGRKLFTDANEAKEFDEEDLEDMSDLKAYVKVCGEDIAQD